MLAQPRNKASELALDIYLRVLDEVRADHLVHDALRLVGSELFIQDAHVDLSLFDRVFVCGAGKASVTMARALENLLGPRIVGGLLVTKAGSEERLDPIEVIGAGHPLPDDRSLAAGARMLELASGMGARDLVLFLLSGGASALMEAPSDSLSLQDLQDTNRVLLGSGLDITAMNAVRSKISRIKGGGLARAFHSATVAAIVLSDVVGNDLRVIGSGPLIDARQETSVPWHVLERLPESVRNRLERALPKPPAPYVEHRVIGSVSLAIQSASRAAAHLGLMAMPFGDPLAGEARRMAKKIGVKAKEAAEKLDGPFCLIFGGETTVKLRGSGNGGRCQELAIASIPWLTRIADSCMLAAGTDGYDGPTDAAGAMIDPGSYCRARDAGVGLYQALSRNDSHAYLDACGGLIRTGPTGTNVNDLVLVVGGV